MTIEILENLKIKYTDKREYFKAIDFPIIASDYEEMITTIDQVIEHLKNTSTSN